METLAETLAKRPTSSSVSSPTSSPTNSSVSRSRGDSEGGLATATTMGFSKEWFALRSKPKQERLAGSLLERAGIEVFVPLVRSRHSKLLAHSHLAQPSPAHLEPFFPSYLFARLDPAKGELRLANYTTGVLHVVGFGDAPTPVPEPIIEQIRQRLANGQTLPHPHFQHGQHVVITKHPFDDIEAVFDRELTPNGRVRVLIQMLERLCPLVLELESLQPKTPKTAKTPKTPALSRVTL